MNVEVLFFAQLRDVFGVGRVTIHVDAPGTVADLARELVERQPEIAGIPIRYAVNDAFVDAAHELHDGDVVAVVHPVSGG